MPGLENLLFRKEERRNSPFLRMQSEGTLAVTRGPVKKGAEVKAPDLRTRVEAHHPIRVGRGGLVRAGDPRDAGNNVAQ